ncbi:conserved hypothetical protein [Sinorhizobium medicae]|uniref:Uncharacterized protein n=1 Tax=Sinorhizobium medicae TaxID=110321 RepID=A0A508X282_9HYPH|nr:conserved hypothetical protein [Sinorhizobium medicae]
MEPFWRSRFSSGQRRLAKVVPQGTAETIAAVPGGKIPGPSGWLKRAACLVGWLGRMLGLRRAPAEQAFHSARANRIVSI